MKGDDYIHCGVVVVVGSARMGMWSSEEKVFAENVARWLMVQLVQPMQPWGLRDWIDLP